MYSNSLGIGSNNKLSFSGIVLSTDTVTAPLPDVSVALSAVIAVNPLT